MLFEPTSIANMPLRNHIVKSATLENMATPEGLPTDDTLSLYERVARGGAGLLITGLTYISPAGKGYPRQHGIHSDAAISAWQRITAAVHEQGARIALQIVHCGRQANVKALGGGRALAPSAVPELQYFTRPRAMTAAEIEQTICDFGEAAGRAKEAGFDAVEIHAAHGYLISSFLSPFTNRRRDDWGGDAERRFRFLGKVYRAVREAVGADYPVLCKLNANDYVPTGLTPRDALPAARRLAATGLDGLELSGGTMVDTPLNVMRGGCPTGTLLRGRSLGARLLLTVALKASAPRARFKEAYFLPYAEQLKPTLGVPLILVGGIRRREAAEQALATGAADLIALGRPLIREPGLPKQWQAGRRESAQCESCNRCLAEVARGNRLRCYCPAH